MKTDDGLVVLNFPLGRVFIFFSFFILKEKTVQFKMYRKKSKLIGD